MVTGSSFPFELMVPVMVVVFLLFKGKPVCLFKTIVVLDFIFKSVVTNWLLMPGNKSATLIFAAVAFPLITKVVSVTCSRV